MSEMGVNSWRWSRTKDQTVKGGHKEEREGNTLLSNVAGGIMEVDQINLQQRDVAPCRGKKQNQGDLDVERFLRSHKMEGEAQES